MTSITREVDFAAYDRLGQPVLLAEVKNQSEPSELWAARFRRNILAHGTLPDAPYFLIATPGRMFFWGRDGGSAEEQLPHFTMDAAHELKPYFEKFGLAPERTRGQALDLVVLSWLNDITESGLARVRQDPSLRWLSESGLLDALGNARIELSPVQ